MAELHKRWGPIEVHQHYNGQNRPLSRWFLGSTPNLRNDPETYMYMACIESYDASNGPFKLEIWNLVDEEWDVGGEFPTLKQAKIMGRLMAGLALTRSA
jgi:hypothetical protein